MEQQDGRSNITLKDQPVGDMNKKSGHTDSGISSHTSVLANQSMNYHFII